MPITEQELNKRVARAQNVIIPAAQRAGRCRTPAHRAALTKLIREVQAGDASLKNLNELAEWTAPNARPFTETAELTEARRLIAEADAAATAKPMALEDLALLPSPDFRQVFEESQRRASGGKSPYWRGQGAPALQLSESAAVAPQSAAVAHGRSREAREADYARANTLPATEARELREALMAEFARTQPFGGRRLDQS